jgi:peptide/nickel transport system substrate-binding protein
MELPMSRKRETLLSCILVLGILLSSCGLPLPETQTATPVPVVPTMITSLPSPEPAPTTTELPRTLAVCLGQEPNSLYPFGTLNMAARSVLGAIYDGPIDVFTNGYQAVILEKTPSIENGDVQTSPVTVKRGDTVIDSTGKLTVLDAGVTILPTGCTDAACAVPYNGSNTQQMDQLVVTFRMLPNLNWSDGIPLTADDSVFAFKLASDAATPGSKYLVDRTKTYETVDEHTVQWWAVPGFIDPTYADNFWSPLPKHLWEKIPAAELARGDVTAHPPIGWGPYVFKDWSAGEYIRLERNPLYFRAAEGLPKFDTLVFRFMKDAPTAIGALIAGQCDILDTSLRLDGQIDLLTELERNEQAKLVTSTTPLIERLDFGISPSSYDDGYAPGIGDRQDIFGDVRTRQGIAYCLDRQTVVNTVLGGLSQVPDTFVSPSHPLFNADTQKYLFDVNTGINLLKGAGWSDADNNPTTPLVAISVKNVAVGTPLVVNYITTSALQRRQVSEILAKSLAQCGVGVNLKYVSQDELYAPGPDGPLFGRSFDLAEYAIGNADSEPPCSWFLSDQIPTRANKWIGLNISGYSNADYDAICKKAMKILPDQAGYKDAYAQVQSIYANDLPSVPLYMRIKAAATRRDMCNFTLDAFAINDLWNIEELDYNPTCGK